MDSSCAAAPAAPHPFWRRFAYALLFGILGLASAAYSATTILYVDAAASAGGNGASWATAYNNLQTAIAAAAPTSADPVEIWLKTGVYKPTAGTDRSARFDLKSYMILRGGFAGTESATSQRPASATATSFTVLSGDIGTPQPDTIGATTNVNDFAARTFDFTTAGAKDNCYIVVRAYGTVSTSLDRVVVAGGYADSSAVSQTQLETMLQPNTSDGGSFRAGIDERVNGGGLWLGNAAFAIVDSWVVGNYAKGIGGGIVTRGGQLDLQNSRLVRNVSGYAGGGISTQATYLRSFNGNTFYGNSAVFLGGGLFVQADTSNKYVKAYESSLLAALAGLTVDESVTLPSLATTPLHLDPNILYDKLKDQKTQLTIAKVIAKKAAEKAGLLAPQKLVTPFTAYATKGFGAALSSSYSWVSYAVTAVDIGVQIAILLGADPNDPFIKGWSTFSAGFAAYATPAGLAVTLKNLIFGALIPGPSFEERATKVRNQDFNDNQNNFNRTEMFDNRFERNFSGGYGGGALIIRENVLFHRCWFVENEATFGGGGASAFAYNNVDFENSAVLRNRSTYGHSAFAFGFRSVDRLVNLTITGNYSAVPSGYAVGVDAGADASLIDCVLWNNTNASVTAGGADCFASRKDDLDEGGLKAYNDAGDSHGLFTGTLDFQYCDIQGLNSLTYGTALFSPTVAYWETNVDPYGINVISGCPNVGEGVRPSVRGNFAREPYLLQDIYPHPNSPLINAGATTLYFRNGYSDDLLGTYRGSSAGRIDVGAVESNGLLPPGTTVYVNAAISASGDGLSWAGAKKTLAEACALPLAAGSQIWIAQGTYYATSGVDRAASLHLTAGCSIVGGFVSGATSLADSNPVTHPTIISGNIANPLSTADNTYCLLNGRDLARGQETLPRIIRNLHFTAANSNSAAVWVCTPVVIQSCTFDFNQGGRALQIDGNSVSNYSATAQVFDCVFQSNYDGALGCSAPKLDVIRSSFWDNLLVTGHGAGLAHTNTDYEAELTLERCVFYHNRTLAGRGGGASFTGRSLNLAHSIFVDNEADPASNDNSDRGGAGFFWNFPTGNSSYYSSAPWTTVNSIFYNNRLGGTYAPTAVEDQQFGMATNPPRYFTLWKTRNFTSNSIEGLTNLATRNGPEGNVDYDPFFVAPASHNFALAADSQLINRGSSYSSSTDTTTVVGGMADIGVIETAYTSSQALFPLTFAALPADANGRTYTLGIASSHSSYAAASSLIWEVRRPGATQWTTVANDAYTSGAGTATLTLTNPPHTWNGSIYRLRIVFNGLRLYSLEQTVSIQPSFLFVKPAATGAGDGTSWANATTLPNALSIAVHFTQIWIAQGTHVLSASYPNSTRVSTGARLYGGFVGTETSLAQRPGVGSAVTHIYSSTGQPIFEVNGSNPATDTPTLFDRLTLDRGPSFSDLLWAFRLNNSACAFTDIALNGLPHGVRIRGGSISFTNLSANLCGTVLDIDTATVSVNGSSFTTCGSPDTTSITAGGIENFRGTVTVADSLFSNCGGYNAGAIYSGGGSGSIDIQRCRFLDNRGRTWAGAVFVSHSSGTRIANSLFARNSVVSQGGNGGAILNYGSLSIVQCTLVANYATYDNAISSAGSTSLINSIVWGNTFPDIGRPDLQRVIGNTYATNSLVQGGGAYDPLFDPASADYALTAYSPALNKAGTDNSVSGTLDLSRNVRRYAGGAADLGATEFAGTPGTPVYLTSPISNQSVYVERNATFSLTGTIGSTVSSTDFTWQYYNGSAWVAISGIANAAITSTSTGSTLTLTAVTLAQNGLQFRATAPGVGSLGTATLTVKPRVILYVDSRVASSGNGLTWAAAFKTITEAIARANGDTDIWIAAGDYADAGITPRAETRVYIGFAGDETSLDQRDPVANPIRVGKPLADATLVIDDVTTLLPPLTLANGQSARWQVDTGDGNWSDLVADADRIISLVNGVPGLSIHANPALTGYRYRVVVSDNTGDLFTSDSAQITVVSRSTVYVDAAATDGAHTGADWANAFNDLSAALAAYPAFADFKIAEGTYTAPAATSFNLRRSLTLTGGYVAGTETRDPATHLTILQTADGKVSSAIALKSNADRGVVDSLTILDGFVFRNAGIGLSLVSASPQIRNCRFENLITGLSAASSTIAVEDSTFTGQTLSGIRTSNQSALQVLRCTFTNNSAGTDVYVGGGAIGMGDGSTQLGPQTLVVTDSTFTGNSAASGGAISVRSFSSTVTITRSRFDGNVATDTGGALFVTGSGSAAVRDSLFVRNQSARFGSAIVSNSPLTLAFTTVAANVAGSHPSNTAISTTSALTVRNSIIWGNTNAGTSQGEFGQYGTNNVTPTFADTILDGLNRTGGARLLPFDPRFVDATNGDFHLAADSPALGLANAADLLPSETDLAGTARPAGAAPDLGAYESAAAPAPTYVFTNLPTALSGYPGANLPALSQNVPTGYSGAWQYYNGSAWITLPDSSSSALPGARSIFVNTQSSAYYTQLSIYNISAPLDGTTLRFVLSAGANTYVSPTIPVTVLAFQTIYVDASRPSSGDGTSWSTAFQTLPEGLAAVDAGRRVIHVAEGSYRGPFVFPMSFEIYGGFPAGGSTLAARDPSAHPTILTGLAANGTDRADVVVKFAFSGNGYSQPVLDGFVVENGHTGLLTDIGVSPTLRHLTIRGHDATGLVFTQSSGASITDSVFENNSGTDGGAIRTVNCSQTLLERVIVRGNTATRGGGLYLGDNTILRSVLVTGNVADTGGAIFFAGSSPQLTQITLAGNRAATAPAIYTRYTTVTLRNSIVWGNRATTGDALVQFAAYDTGTYFIFDHTTAEQAPTTTGVFRADPLFVSAIDAASAPTTTGDYRVRTVSPAIDAGADALASGIALDVASQPRIVGTVDVGAYESTTTGITPLAVTTPPAALAFHRSGSGNTFTVSATGAASILWQSAAPNGAWTSLDGVAGFSGATTATLTVTSATSALNGYQFRAAVTGADGSVVYSDASTLTVYVPRFYVNAARSGSDAGDGLAWATAFRTLDAALAVAPLDPEGTEFWIAAGTYTPATVYTVRRGLAFYGGFAGTESSLSERDLAANITAFTAAAGQSAIFVTALNPAFSLPVRFDGLTLRDSAVTAIDNTSACALDLDRVRFTGLRAALFSRNGAVTLRRVEVRGNGDSSNTTIVTVIGGTVLVENSLFAGNRLASGSITYFYAPTVVRHTTFAANLATSPPLYFGDANNQTYNCIFWGNRSASSPSLATSLDGSARLYVVWNSVVENLPALTSRALSLVADTTADPRFVAPLAATAAPFTSGDFSLASTSPAIDLGKNDQTSSDAIDLAGQPRQHGVHVDPGAYEYQADDIYTLTTQPASTYASAVTPATFTVAGSRAATFTWEVSTDNGQNYTAVPSATAATLAVPGAAELDGALYRARVQFTTGPELVSDAATLTFLNPVVTATAPAGFATPASFSATANKSVTAWQWQVSLGDAAFADVSGATANTLDVSGDASFANRTYRVQATFAAGPTVVSNTVAFIYADAIPATTSASALAFSLAGGVVDSASLNDTSFAVLPQFSGRLSLTAGDLTPAFNGAGISFTFAEPLAAGSRVFVTTTSALHRADGVGARPQVWEYRVPTVSGSGVFAPPTALSLATASTLAAGDVDGDGTLDLLVADTDGLRVWRNDGLGAFTADASAWSSASAKALALGSLTANSTLDAVVVTATGDVEIYTNDAAGHFTLAQALPSLAARAIALGDLDADGDLDLVVATATGNRVYLNNGSAAFTPGATFGSATGTSVVLADFDRDGDLDAIVTSATNTVVYSNNSSATFTAALTSATPADRVAVADLDADGRPDVILTRADQPARLWRNTAAFQFTTLAAAPGGGTITTLAAGDIDGDGRADLLLTDAVGTTAPWLTASDLSSTPLAGQPLLNLGADVTLADVDGDGALDLVGLDASGHPTVSLYHLTATQLDEETTSSLASAGFTPTPTTVHIASLPAHGTLLNGATPVQIGDAFPLAAAASLTYVPAADFNGLDGFTWSDTASGTAHTYWILVNPVVDSITATADALTVAQGGTATALTGEATTVLANDINDDPGTFAALVVTRPAHGTLTLASDGTFTYAHDNSETRTDSFTYRAKNLVTGAAADATVAITIANVNAAPTAVALATAAGTHYTGQSAGDTVALLSASDPDPEDAGLLTFTLVTGTGDTGNADFTIAGTSLQTAGPVDASLGLTRSVRIRATDPAGLWFEQTFTVSFTEAPTPLATSATTDEDTAKSLTLTATGGAATLTYEIVTAPAHGSLTLNSQPSTLNSFTYLPSADYQGADSFTFRVTDGTITSAPATVSLTINSVNDAPTLATHEITTDEDTPVTFTLAGADVENDALTYHIYTNPRLGSLAINGASATYMPSHLGGQFGTEDSFLLYVDDGSPLGFSSPVLFTAHVTAVPHAPVLTALPDAGFGGNKNEPITFTAHATDLDGDFVSYHVGTAPAHGSVRFSGADVTYVPAYNYSGADTFTIVASDGTLDSAPVTATVAISDPAPTAYDLSFTGAQHSTLHGYFQGSDAQNDALTYQVLTAPAHGSTALHTEVVTVNNTSVLTFWIDYTPDAAFNGADSLTYVAIDPAGQVSAPATITFNVTANNLAPVAADVSVSQLGLAANATTTVTLAATDAEGDTLTYRIVTPPTHGQLAGDGSPAVTYTLDAAPFVGTDTFTYVANDGTQDSAPATVTLNFTKDVRAAHTVGDLVDVYRGLGTDIDVLANDHDDWGDPMFVFAVTQPAHGTVIKFSDHVHYSHNGDSATDDEFTYTVSNFSGLTVTEHVFVTVKGYTINVTSNADSGEGSLRAALDTVNRYAFTPLTPSGDRAVWTINLILTGGAATIDAITPGTLNDIQLVPDYDTIGASAYEIQGKVTLQGLSSSDRTTIAPHAAGGRLRAFYIDPHAQVTLKNLDLTGGTAHLGGAILNDGALTLENVTLSANTADADADAPGRGGALYNRGSFDTAHTIATLALTNVTLSDNVATEGAGLYQADGEITAHSATFSGHDATARDYRLAAGKFTAESLTADTPDAPWFGPLTPETIRSHFTQTIPVSLAAGSSLAVTSQVPWSEDANVLLSGPSFSVSGRGDTRTITTDLGASPTAGPIYLTATATSSGVTFVRTAQLTVDPALVRTPVAVDDYITVASFGTTIPVHDLLLANDSDPDGLNLFINDYSQPQYGSVSEVGGVLSYTSPNLSNGSEETFTYTITNGTHTATATVHVLILPNRTVAVTSAADSDAGTLRAAVAQATQYGAQPWTLSPSGLSSPALTLATAAENDLDLGASALVITTDVTIDGAGVADLVLSPDASAAPMRLFRIAPGGKLTLRNLTVSGGSAHLGGAIYNEGTLVLDHTTLSGDTATALGTSAAGLGGAIYNAGGSVTLTSSTLETNTALDAADTSSASGFGLGGALYTRNGAVTLTDSALSDNAAHNGGGLFADGAASATVTFNTSVLDNPYAIADLAASGTVAFHRTNSTIARIDGPSIGSLTDQTIDKNTFTNTTTGSVAFAASDEVTGLALSASSSVDGVIPNSSLAVDTTDGVHHLNFTAALSGICNLTLTASAGGISFNEHFRVVANTGTAANPTVYPQSGGTIYPLQSRILDPITGKVYYADGSQLSGGNGPASDPIGLPLTVVSVTQPAHGTATINSDGRIVYTHTDTAFTSGSDEFFFTVSNGFGGTATTGAQVTITPAELTVTNISEFSSALATAIAQPATPWTIRINAGASDQSWSTTSISFGGNLYAAFQITAGHVTIDASNSPGFAFHIGAYGPPPRFFVVYAGAELVLKNLRLVGGSAYDSFGFPQGGAVLNRGTFTADHVSFENNNTYSGYGTGSGGALYNDAGIVSLVDCSFTNNRANNSGKGGAIASRNGTLSLFNITFSGNTASLANDIYLLGDAATATLIRTGTPSADALFATANGGAVDATPFKRAPVAEDDSFAIRPDGSAVVPIDLLLGNDSDADGDEITFVSADTETYNGTGAITIVSGNIVYIPYDANTAAGDDSFDYTITDSDGNTATASVYISDIVDNQPPTLDAIAPVTVLEDASAPTVALTGISAGIGETQNLTITATSSNPALIPDPTITYTNGDATGTLTLAPAANASGTAKITVTLQDDGGILSDGNDTLIRTFTVTVTPVNDAPTLDAIADPAAILENATDQTVALTGIGTGPASESAQSLTITATSSNPALVADPTVSYTAGDTTGSLTYAPISGQSGTATITVTLHDDGGTADTGTDTLTRTFTVTVTPVNDPPTLDPIADPAAILEDATEQTLPLSGISSGYLETQNVAITATSDNTALIPNPTVTYTPGASTGSLAYTPAANASGAATITVTLHDDGGTDHGGVDTFTRTFTVTVTPQPEPPPTVTIAPRNGGDVTLHLAGQSGTSYTIYVSTDLSTWSVLTTVTTDAGGTADLDDTTAPAAGAARFYRADAD